MDDRADTYVQPVSHSMLEQAREHHRRRPILMVFIMAIILSLLFAGSVFAFIALTSDNAEFRSSISSSNPVRQHILRVEGAGELVADLRDRTDNDEDRVRFDLSLLSESGDVLDNVVSSSKGQRIQISQTVEPGDYTFIVQSPDSLTEVGASYSLSIDYPNDTASFEDQTAPQTQITSPELGATVSGVFAVSGEASDNDEVTQVSVRLDDEPWVVAEGTNSWSLAINSEEFANGQRIISVRATDSSGNNSDIQQTLLNFNNMMTDVSDPAPEEDNSSNNQDDSNGQTDDGNSDSSGSGDSDSGPAPQAPTSGDGSPMVQGDFFEDFTGNTGTENFKFGVYHRNIDAAGFAGFSGGSWQADHNEDCGPPTTSRTMTFSAEDDQDTRVANSFYLCRNHLMSTMGDVDNYSIAWFKPNAEFSRNDQKTVSWDVNVTDLGARQWWEVSIVPTGSEFLATISWLANTANISNYDDGAVVVGNGPFGNNVKLTTNNKDRYNGWQKVCGQWALDTEACNSKAIRRTFSITDNMNGTLTVDYGGMFTQNIPGQLPDSYEVYFKDHNYTPDKDGKPSGYTWHWDNISVQ